MAPLEKSQKLPVAPSLYLRLLYNAKNIITKSYIIIIKSNIIIKSILLLNLIIY